MTDNKLTHFDASGNAVMVDVSEKTVTFREATAHGIITMNAEAFAAVESGTVKKGDVLGVARIAGIMATKRTSELIPLCHPLPLTKVSVDFRLLPERQAVEALCTVKTAGVDESILRFEGKARVFESQEEACDGILGGKVKAGDVVVIRYEGPKGGPGMQEMLYPTSYLKSVNLGKACALITDGRFSGGTSGLSIGHVSPEAAAGGDIALVKDDDTILIDIPNRTINVELTSEELDMRRQAIVRFEPVERNRVVSRALKAYASMVTSADKGGVRENI